MSLANYQLLKRLMVFDRELRRNGGCSTSVLARHGKCSQRTVQRDIERMRGDFGMPIHSESGLHRYDDDTFPMPLISVTSSELFAIYLAERLLGQYVNTAMHQQLKSAFVRITALIPDDEVLIRLDDLSNGIVFDPGPVRPETRDDIFRQLQTAVHDRRTIDMQYHSLSRDQTTRRRVDPYLLLNHRGDWYVSGYCHLRQAMRDFALTRIRRLGETTDHFTIPADFDRKDYLERHFDIFKGGNPVDVVLRFKPHAARWIREKTWHNTEKKQLNADGTLTLTMTVPLTRSLTSWILSHGSAVKVLEPDALKRQVVEEIEAMVEGYGG